jgi:hypothetical protein
MVYLKPGDSRHYIAGTTKGSIHRSANSDTAVIVIAIGIAIAPIRCFPDTGQVGKPVRAQSFPPVIREFLSTEDRSLENGLRIFLCMHAVLHGLNS